MKKRDYQKIRIFCDLPILIASSVCFVGTSLFFSFFAFANKHNSDPHENMVVQIMLLVLSFGGLFIWVWNLPQWSANALLTPEGIYFSRAFKETVFTPYEDYRHLYRGEYFHSTVISGIGSVRTYVVFSKKKLSSHILSHINSFPPSLDVIKLRSSKKNVSKLQKILPAPQLKKLNCYFK